MNIADRAKLFATAAHAAVGQKRKYTGEPYIVHPIAVATILTAVTDDKDIIAAAYLHDTVEDTQITIEDLADAFGPRVAMIVHYVTDASIRYPEYNRAKRKEIDRQHIASGPYESQLLKLADLIHNTESITEHDPKFARVYMKEKEALLQVLDKVKDTGLYRRAMDAVENYYNDTNMA